jgi:hypothetical protein
MIIFVEKGKNIKEGTWSTLPPGKEIITYTAAKSDIALFKRRYYSTFGDDKLFDSLGDVEDRLLELAAVNFVGNQAQAIKGNISDRTAATVWIKNKLKLCAKLLGVREFSSSTTSWVFHNAMQELGLRK